MQIIPKGGLFLILITGIGAFLRFYNLFWDKGYFFQPDERFIPAASAQIHFFDQLNPNFFFYGSFSIYLFRALGDILTYLTHNQVWITWVNLNLIGRGVSASVSSLTIIAIFFLGKRFGGNRLGFLAAFLIVFAPGAIQFAHFSTTESLLIFWVTLLTYFSLAAADKPTLWNYLKVGIILGLAVATKITALSFLVIPAATHFTAHLKSPKHHLKFLFSLVFSLVTFALFSPYVLLDYSKFLESMKYATAVATQPHREVFVLQFEGTTPYLFQIGSYFWLMGPAALMAILGVAVLLAITLKKGRRNYIILLSFPLIYFLWSGQWYAKHIRYNAPLLPFLTLFAAWFLLEIKKNWEKLGSKIVALIMIATFLWGMAFFSIYTREQTRITASKWIYQNIPPGAKILVEHWDNQLPLDLPPNLSNVYKIEALTIYDPDGEKKLNYYTNRLSQADYLILSSRRLYGTLIRLNNLYPLTSRYYRLLFSGELGYTPLAHFSSYPKILGFEINDDQSEETFQVFDHPKVIIFENKERLSENHLKNIFTYGN